MELLTPFLGPTFHEDHEDVSDDGEGGEQDKYREQEGADWVGHLVLRLKEEMRQ